MCVLNRFPEGKKERNVKYGRTCVCPHVCVHVCMCMCVLMHACVLCAQVCLPALSHVFVHAFMYMSVCFVCARVFACRMCVHVHLCLFVSVSVYKHVYLCVHVYVCVCAFVCLCACMQQCACLYCAFQNAFKQKFQSQSTSLAYCSGRAHTWKPYSLALGLSLCPSLCPAAAGEQEGKPTAPQSWGLRLPHQSSKIDALLTEFNNLAL